MVCLRCTEDVSSHYVVYLGMERSIVLYDYCALLGGYKGLRRPNIVYADGVNGDGGVSFEIGGINDILGDGFGTYSISVSVIPMSEIITPFRSCIEGNEEALTGRIFRNVYAAHVLVDALYHDVDVVCFSVVRENIPTVVGRIVLDAPARNINDNVG